MNRKLVIAAAIAGGALAALLVTRWCRRLEEAEDFDLPRTDDGDPITQASEDSFPASDPPAHTVTTGAIF